MFEYVYQKYMLLVGKKLVKQMAKRVAVPTVRS